MTDESTPKNQPTGNYEVGWCRPPKSGQWQKGQSGNPKGRRKQRLITDLAEAYHEAGLEIVRIPIRGKMRRMTLRQAVAFKAYFDAALGDPSARREVNRIEEVYAQRHPVEQEIVCELVFPEEEGRQAKVLEQNRRYVEEWKKLQGLSSDGSSE